MNRPLKACIVGAGKISEQHLRFLATTPLAHLAGVADPASPLLAYATARYGGRAYADFVQMLHAERPDVVHVLTPPHTHEEIALAVVDAGAHVILEKPAALSTQGVERIIAAAAPRGLVVTEDHNYRFNRHFLQLERAVQNGRYGALVDISICIGSPIAGSRYADEDVVASSHRLPGGHIHEFLTHLAYLNTSLMMNYDTVQAQWSRRTEIGPPRWDELEVVVTRGETRSHIHFTSASGPTIRVRVDGSSGWGEVDLAVGSFRESTRTLGGAQLGPLVSQVRDGGRLIADGVRSTWSKLFGTGGYEGLHTFLRETYLSLHGARDLPVQPEHMIRVSRLIDDIVVAAA